MFFGVNMFSALLRTHFSPCSKMSLTQAHSKLKCYDDTIKNCMVYTSVTELLRTLKCLFLFFEEVENVRLTNCRLQLLILVLLVQKI